MPQPRRQPPPQPAPPPQGVTAAEVAAALGVAAGAAGATGAALAPAAATAAGTALTAGAIAAATNQVLGAFAAVLARRGDDVFLEVQEVLGRERPELDADARVRLARREALYEREFQRKALERLRRDLPRAIATADPADRRRAVAAVLDRERRYVRQREQAMIERSLGAADVDYLLRESPEGAYWKLSEAVREHTLDCLAMGERFWPWSVLRGFHPPLHHGCPCRLIGLEEAKALGLMTDADVPDERDAIRRAAQARELAQEARAEGVEDEDVEAWLEVLSEAEALEEAARGRYGARKGERFGKGHTKGGQFKPRRGAAPGRPARRAVRALRRLLPRLPRPPAREDGYRWQWVAGRYTRVPARQAWSREVDGVRFHSPPGSTAMYRDDRLISEPGRPPQHQDAERPLRIRDEALGRLRGRVVAKASPETGPEDTPQQKAILRQSRTARKVRRDYPAGTRVEATKGPGTAGNGTFGIVLRHVPGTDAQGGSLTVQWENGQVGRVTPGSVRRADAPKPSPAAEAAAELRRALERDVADRAAAAVEKGDPASPPVTEADGPEAFDALRYAGFVETGVAPTEKGVRRSFAHPSGATLEVEWDGKTIVSTVWKPGEGATEPRRSKGTPDSFEAAAQDALALARELGELYDAPVLAAEVRVDPNLGDHAGAHHFDGRVEVGVETPMDVEAIAKARRAGRDPNEFELRGAWASARVFGHEIAHAVNPIDMADYGDDDAARNLEEALAEEAGHLIARERLAAQGQHDVLAWADANPASLPVAGVYRAERGALADLLDEAGIDDPDERRQMVLDLAFRIPPADRLDVLAALMGGDHEESRQRAGERLRWAGRRVGEAPRGALERPAGEFLSWEEVRASARAARDGTVTARHRETGEPTVIGRVYRSDANPRYWVAETNEGYILPVDAATRGEAVRELADAHRSGVAPGDASPEPSPIPPMPGEAPVPEGMVRLFHYTYLENLEGIRSEGLLKEKGRGDSGAGVDEPSRGVWASTMPPGESDLHERAYVEFWVRPDDISYNAEHFWNRDPVEWATDGLPHHVILHGDAPPEQIVAVHEPWHQGYRYLQDDRDAVLRGEYDWVLDSDATRDQYGEAVRLIKAEGAQPSPPTDDERVPVSVTRHQAGLIADALYDLVDPFGEEPHPSIDFWRRVSAAGPGEERVRARVKPDTLGWAKQAVSEWTDRGEDDHGLTDALYAAPRRSPATGYEPEGDAPEAGEYVMEDTPLGPSAGRWRQAHGALLRDAVRSWKGWPSDMRIHMVDEQEGAPQPSSGGGKQRRAQAGALLWELENRARPNDRPLYRGSHLPPGSVTAWSEDRRVAAKWARKSGGEVVRLEPGQARGLRVADIAPGGIDESEREWIVLSDPKASPATAGRDLRTARGGVRDALRALERARALDGDEEGAEAALRAAEARAAGAERAAMAELDRMGREAARSLVARSPGTGPDLTAAQRQAVDALVAREREAQERLAGTQPLGGVTRREQEGSLGSGEGVSLATARALADAGLVSLERGTSGGDYYVSVTTGRQGLTRERGTWTMRLTDEGRRTLGLAVPEDMAWEGRQPYPGPGPPAASPAPRGFVRVPPEPAPDVGIRLDRSPDGDFELSDTLANYQFGDVPGSGHFGTGVYFTSGAPDTLRLGSAAERHPAGVSLQGRTLYRPPGEAEGLALHAALHDLNTIAKLSADGESARVGGRREIDVESVAAQLPEGADGSRDPARAEHAVRYAISAHRDALARGDLGGDIASTHAMRALGYDGIDTRGLPALDNTAYGSVLYRGAIADPDVVSHSGGGAVVGGRSGRWVWIRGMYRHIPSGEAWDELADGVRFYSPRGGTDVYRFDPQGAEIDPALVGQTVAIRDPDGTLALGELGDLLPDGTAMVNPRDGSPTVSYRPENVGVPVARPRWNGHPDVRNPRRGGTPRGGQAPPPAPPEPPGPTPVRDRYPEIGRMPLGTRFTSPDGTFELTAFHDGEAEFTAAGDGSTFRMGQAARPPAHWLLAPETGPRPGPAGGVPEVGERVQVRMGHDEGAPRFPALVARVEDRLVYVTLLNGDPIDTPYPLELVTRAGQPEPPTPPPEPPAPVLPPPEAGIVEPGELRVGDRIWHPEGGPQGGPGLVAITAIERARVGVNLHFEPVEGRVIPMSAWETPVMTVRAPDAPPAMRGLGDERRESLLTAPGPPYHATAYTTVFPGDAREGLLEVAYDPELAEPYAEGKIRDGLLVVGVRWYMLDPNERERLVRRIEGAALAGAIDSDETTRGELENLWTDGKFGGQREGAGQVWLDRDSPHRAVASAYQRLTEGGWADHAETWPDALRFVALEADRHGLPLEDGVLEWARDRTGGGPLPPPPDGPDPLGVRALEGLPRSEAEGRLHDQGYVAEIAYRDRIRTWRRVAADGTIEVVNLRAEGNLVHSRVVQALGFRSRPDDPELAGARALAARLVGTPTADMHRPLEEAGYLKAESRAGRRVFVHATDQHAIEINQGPWVPGGGQTVEQAVAVRLDAALSDMRVAAILRSNPLELPDDAHIDQVRHLVDGRPFGMSVRSEAPDPDGGTWLTVQRVEDSRTPNLSYRHWRVLFGADGRIVTAGLPGEGETGFAGGDEAERIRAGIEEEMRVPIRERAARVRALQDQIREAVNAGREPFRGGEDYDEVRAAMRELGYADTNKRRLRDGGSSVTWKNRRTQAKLIVRMDPPEDGTTRVRANSRVETGVIDLGRVRVRGRMPASEAEWTADFFGRADELGERYGTGTDVRRLRFGRRGDGGEFTYEGRVPSDHAGFHRALGGLVVAGTGTLPSLQRVWEARAAGRDLTDREREDVYGAYKLLQHELHHGTTGRREGYNHSDGSRGIEEALTEELAHIEVVDWLESHGLDDVVEWARRNPDSGTRRGTYLGYRQAFGNLLDRAGVAQEDRLPLMRRWKFQATGADRRRELAELIARNQGLEVDAAMRTVAATMAAPHDYVPGFRAILRHEYGEPGEAPPPEGPELAFPPGARVRVLAGSYRGREGVILERTRPGEVRMRLDSGGTVTAPMTNLRVLAPPTGGEARPFRVGERVRGNPERGRSFRGRVIDVNPENGDVKIKKIGRGEEVWVPASRVERLDGGPARPPAPPEPPPPPSPDTATLAGGGTVGVGARVRGRVSGQLATVERIEGSGPSARVHIRRDDNSTHASMLNELNAIVITDEGHELALGAEARAPGDDSPVWIRDIDWTDPQSPKARLATTQNGTDTFEVNARELRPAGDAPLLTVTGSDGSPVPVNAGDRVRLRGGTTATIYGRRLRSWPRGEVEYATVGRHGVLGGWAPANAIVGPVGEPPAAPADWRTASVERSLTALGRAHYRRQASARGHADAVGNALGVGLGAQVQEWWEAKGFPTRRPGGAPAGTPKRPVYRNRATPPEKIVGLVIRDVYASEAEHDAVRDAHPELYAMVRGLAGQAMVPWPNWRERVPPEPPAPPAPPGEMNSEAVLRAAWTGTFGSRGLRAEVMGVRGAGRDQANIEGRIVTPQGETVGHFRREVRKSGDRWSVYHASLQISRQHQGGGFAREFNRHAEGIYRAKGVHAVTVGADIDIGGYAWAATGFDWKVYATPDTPEQRALERAKQARRMLDNALARGTVTQAEWDSVVGRFVDPGDSNTAAVAGKIQHAWELASLGDDHALGKKIMLGTSWSGIKVLVGPERSPFAG